MVNHLMEVLKITDALTVGEILHAKGIYSTPQSARVNAQKKLNERVALGNLERGPNYYRIPGCTSEFKEHAQLITKTLAELLKLEVTPLIFREPVITEVGLRPDAICLITKDNRGLCLILEVCNNETEAYYQSKVNVWENWPGSLDYLSQLFKYVIPHFDIVKITDFVGFKSYLEEVI